MQKQIGNEIRDRKSMKELKKSGGKSQDSGEVAG